MRPSRINRSVGPARPGSRTDSSSRSGMRWILALRRGYQDGTAQESKSSGRVRVRMELHGQALRAGDLILLVIGHAVIGGHAVEPHVVARHLVAGVPARPAIDVGMIDGQGQV